DVQYQRPKGQKVASASLVFKLMRPDAVGQVKVTRLIRAWGEGKGRGVPTSYTKPEDPLTWSAASWNTAFFGGKDDKWASSGASGERDSRPITGVEGTQEGVKLTIRGLESVVQSWINDPSKIFGLRIEFSRDAVLERRESRNFAPELQLTWV